jgi:hypothetical protein
MKAVDKIQQSIDVNSKVIENSVTINAIAGVR